MWNPNVPELPSDPLATSQPEILSNFATLFNAFLVNHISLAVGAGAGNHSIVELVQQGAAFQTVLNEISAYTKNAPDQTDQLFLRYQGNGQEFQYSNYQIYSVAPQNGQIPFFTFLPGRILVYFGSFTQLPNNTLFLYPGIAKTIFGISFCPSGPIGAAPVYKPKIDLNPGNNGLFSSMQVTNAVGVNQIAPPSFYIILANI
jgi:hypothetical protein